MTSHPQNQPTDRGRPRWLIPAVLVGVIVLAVGGGLWYFFSDDAPDEVDLEAVAAAVTETTQPTDDPSDDTGAAPTTTEAPGSDESPDSDDAVGGDATGTWAVDTSIGDFSFEEATASFAGFRVEEELANIGSTTAVGRSPAVAGTVVIDGTTVSSATFEVDFTQMVSNESRREDAILRAINASEFPTGTFTITEPIELGDAATDGEVVAVDAIGELTVAGVTNSITIPLEAQLIDGRILVVGSTDITFADYGVTAPSAPIVVSVEDVGILEIQMWLSPA